MIKRKTREAKLAHCRSRIAHWEARREAAVRTIEQAGPALKYLRAEAARHLKALLVPAPVKREPVVDAEPATGEAHAIPDLPGFLARPKPSTRDAEQRAAVQAEVDAAKAAKTKARIDRMKADKSGERRRMPLTGKAAMKFISGE